MVYIPLSHRTIPGLSKAETRAILFIVQEWRKIESNRTESPQRVHASLNTNHVTKHLGTTQVDTMKLLRVLRQQGFLTLRPRKSAGPTGYGWAGSLYGELTPSPSAFFHADRLVLDMQIEADT
jgi:hypothetical protein